MARHAAAGEKAVKVQPVIHVPPPLSAQSLVWPSSRPIISLSTVCRVHVARYAVAGEKAVKVQHVIHVPPPPPAPPGCADLDSHCASVRLRRSGSAVAICMTPAHSSYIVALVFLLLLLLLLPPAPPGCADLDSHCASVRC